MGILILAFGAFAAGFICALAIFALAAYSARAARRLRRIQALRGRLMRQTRAAVMTAPLHA